MFCDSAPFGSEETVNLTTLNALTAALEADQPVQRVFISRKPGDRRVDRIKQLCKERAIPYQFVPPAAIDRRAGSRDHQGVFAETAPVRLWTLEEVLPLVHSGLIVALDGVVDPGNLGAVVRTAAALEVDAILFPSRAAAPINETVLNASAGTLPLVRMTPVTNLARALEILKEKEFWIFGTAATASAGIYDTNFPSRTVIVLGGEGKGISPGVERVLDERIAIPISEKVESLNVAAAAAVILFEVARQRRSRSLAAPTTS